MRMTIAGLSPAAVLFALLVAAAPGAAPAQNSYAGPGPGPSICRPSETVLFSCAIKTKTVSICGQKQQDRAVYRFGRRGHVELETADLHFASTGFSGGGEEQVLADTPTHRYVVYTGIYRTNYEDDGRHDPKEESGLFVQRGGQTISSQLCRASTVFNPLTRTLMPEGEYVQH